MRRASSFCQHHQSLTCLQFDISLERAKAEQKGSRWSCSKIKNYIFGHHTHSSSKRRNKPKLVRYQMNIKHLNSYKCFINSLYSAMFSLSKARGGKLSHTLYMTSPEFPPPGSFCSQIHIIRHILTFLHDTKTL